VSPSESAPTSRPHPRPPRPPILVPSKETRPSPGRPASRRAGPSCATHRNVSQEAPPRGRRRVRSSRRSPEVGRRFGSTRSIRTTSPRIGLVRKEGRRAPPRRARAPERGGAGSTCRQPCRGSARG
jgi:hypothetical protein